MQAEQKRKEEEVKENLRLQRELELVRKYAIDWLTKCRARREEVTQLVANLKIDATTLKEVCVFHDSFKQSDFSLEQLRQMVSMYQAAQDADMSPADVKTLVATLKSSDVDSCVSLLSQLRHTGGSKDGKLFSPYLVKKMLNLLENKKGEERQSASTIPALKAELAKSQQRTTMWCNRLQVFKSKLKKANKGPTTRKVKSFNVCSARQQTRRLDDLHAELHKIVEQTMAAKFNIDLQLLNLSVTANEEEVAMIFDKPFLDKISADENDEREYERHSVMREERFADKLATLVHVKDVAAGRQKMTRLFTKEELTMARSYEIDAEKLRQNELMN